MHFVALTIWFASFILLDCMAGTWKMGGTVMGKRPHHEGLALTKVDRQ